MLQREQKMGRREGFTLMELLVVVAIIVVLAGAAVPLFMNRYEEAKRKTAWATTKTLLAECQHYRLNLGDYPTDIKELVVPPGGGTAYIKEQDLLDPWQHPFMYAYPGSHNTVGEPDIWSQGSNPADTNGQIGSWMPPPH